MLFWTGFLVFLASMMIYLLLPARTDQVALDHYRDDPLIVSFVNQHQAAKDYMEQMIMWKNTGEVADILAHPFNNEDLAKFLPKGMQTKIGGVSYYHDIGIQDEVETQDIYVSGMVCLDSTNALAVCDGNNNKYIITYGYAPSWWDKHNMHRQGAWVDDDGALVLEKVWLKPMLKRTHGTTLCGRFLTPEDDQPNPVHHFVINNGQEYGGFIPITVNGKKYKVLPDKVGEALVDLLPNGDDPVLLCMTPYQYPYVETPIFHWDISNNVDGHAHTNIGGSSFGDALIGSLSGRAMNCGGSVCAPSGSYTLSATIRGGTTSGILMNLNTSTPVQYTCAGGSCSLTIGSLTKSGIPANKGISFTYIGSSTEQKLNVFYCKSGEVCNFKNLAWETSATAAPTLSGATLESANLLDVMLYDEALSDVKVLKNNKTNHKRFGI